MSRPDKWSMQTRLGAKSEYIIFKRISIHADMIFTSILGVSGEASFT